jgi:hypothetical protein
MFNFRKRARNYKVFDDLQLRFARATFSNGKPFTDQFNLKIIDNDKDADNMEIVISMKGQLNNDRPLMELLVEEWYDGKTRPRRFDETTYSRKLMYYSGTNKEMADHFWSSIKEWCNKMGNMIYTYRTRLDEIEVLKKTHIEMEYDAESVKFLVVLAPIDFEGYIDNCKNTYKDFLYGDDYKDYIVTKFAETRKDICYEAGSYKSYPCGGFKEIHSNEPVVTVYTYNQWLNDIYLPELKQKENDEKIKELLDLIAEKRKNMPQTI